MYHINKNKDKPDIGYMQYTAEKLMKRGIRIRLESCKEMLEYYTDLEADLEADFKEKYGVQNVRSPKQLQRLLITLSDKLPMDKGNAILEYCYNSETGKWTTAAEAMEPLADLGYEFAQDLLDYRKVKKLKESVNSIIEFTDSERLIHPRVSLAKTNRINYSDPALMNIPKELLWKIIEPYEGDKNALFSADIKNQEPSILINLLGIDELKPALKSKDGLYETIYKKCFRATAVANILNAESVNESKVGISPAMTAAIKPPVEETYLVRKTGVSDSGDIEFEVLGRIQSIDTICKIIKTGEKPELPSHISVELEDNTLHKVPITWDTSIIDSKYTKGKDYEVVGTLISIDEENNTVDSADKYNNIGELYTHIEVSKVGRKEFKTSWLAISYGSSIQGIKQTCKTIDGGRVYRYITGIPGIKDYRSRMDKYAKSGSTTIGTVFGTRLNTEVYDSDWKRIKRVLMDLPIQGSGADILALLIKHFYDYTEEHGLQNKIQLYYTRHDELIIEVDGDYVREKGEDYVKNIIKDMVEYQVDDWVPCQLEVDIVNSEFNTGDSESKRDELLFNQEDED